MNQEFPRAYQEFPREQSLSYKLIRNTIYNIIGHFGTVLVTLFLTPYIIQHIGLERFGIWVMVGVITGYFGLLDFGMGSSFIKYIAEFYTKGDHQKINQIINTGIVFYSLFAIFVITLFSLIARPLFTFLRIPAHLYNEALFVFCLGVIIFGIYNAISAFEAIPSGLQRMDISNKVKMVILLPKIVGTIFFLERGYGLPGLMINNAIILIISSVVGVFVGFRLLPGLTFNPRLSTKEMFKRLFGFGAKTQVGRLAGLINYHIVKLLSSHFLNLGLVGFYELGQKIIMFVRDSLMLNIASIMPAAAEIEAKQDSQSMHELYFRVSKYLHAIAIPLMILVFVCAPLIILAWMGSEYKTSVLVIRILIPAHLIGMLTSVGGYIACGLGKPGIVARSLVISAILNLVISTILIIKIGFVGALMGNSISLIIGSLIFIYLFNKHLKTSFGLFMKRTVSRPLLASIISGVFIYLLLKYYYRICSFSLPRITNLSFLTLNGIIFACIYGIIILKTNYLDQIDRNNIIKIFKFLKLRR